MNFNVKIMPRTVLSSREPAICRPYRLISILLSTLFLLALTGCGNKTAEKEAVPFTALTLEHTLEDMLAKEGEGYESYPSIYEGTTYTYDRNYLEKDGTVKYMYDKDGVLQNIAWTYSCDNAAEIRILFNRLHNEIKTIHGEPTETTPGVNNEAEIWRSDSGNIILSTVTTSDAKMLQVAYLSPAVSKN